MPSLISCYILHFRLNDQEADIQTSITAQRAPKNPVRFCECSPIELMPCDIFRSPSRLWHRSLSCSKDHEVTAQDEEHQLMATCNPPPDTHLLLIVFMYLLTSRLCEEYLI